jgi:hypothetical protein
MELTAATILVAFAGVFLLHERRVRWRILDCRHSAVVDRDGSRAMPSFGSEAASRLRTFHKPSCAGGRVN